MALEAGTRLGHYEVVSSLGAGGMGEVYRAKDTKLGREVAIKLLLEEVSADPERLARFEREAKPRTKGTRHRTPTGVDRRTSQSRSRTPAPHQYTALNKANLG